MRKLVPIICLIWAAGAAAMGYRPEHIAADSAWLVKIQERIENYDTLYEAARWEFYITGSRPERLGWSGSKLGEIIYRKYNRKRLERIQGLFENEILSRTARVTYIDFQTSWSYLGTGISTLRNPLLEILINHRASFEGEQRTDGYLSGLIRQEQDRSRREAAWNALVSVGSKIAPGLKELVRKRNKLARQMRYDDFYEMKLSAMGITLDNLFSVLHRLESATRQSYRTIVKRMMDSLEVDTLMPWDFGFYTGSKRRFLDSGLKKKNLLEVVSRTMAGLGYSMDTLSFILDLKSRPGKSQHALCLSVHVPHDIRILANIGSGFGSYRTMFHEYGHALHFSHISQPYYMLRQSPASCFSEGMAEFNESIVFEPEWLVNYAGIPDSSIDYAVDVLAEARIISLRFSLARVYFERELYRTNAKDAGRLYWDIMSEITYCGRSSYLDAWASVYHFTGNPAYLHNYILGRMIAAQTLAYLKRTNGTVIDNEATSEFLIDNYFRPGASKDWFELIEDATGEPLNAKYYIEDLLGK